VKDQSIKSQARDIKVPELDDPAKVHAGFRNYQAMCVSCHNAPGAEESELSKGLYPPAPNLAEAAPNRTSAELYMIIKHGIKMSGMPAWEPTHSGDEIWGLVAFLRVLPDMSPEEYRAAAESTKAAGKGEDMRH
jgi:mono/diheme cytochrome c family protein